MISVKVAAVTMQSLLGKIKKNVDRICYWVNEAKKLNVDIICFPELSITGYTNDVNISSIAISLSNRNIEKLILLSNSNNLTIMPGIAEKSKSGKIYATHLVINPNRKIYTYRKIHIAPQEKATFSKGKTFSLFQIKGINIGIQLCYDTHFPELSTYMSLRGADIIFMPHASPRGSATDKHTSWMRHLPARSFDNGIFVVACNQTGSNGNRLYFPGNAVILSPLGKIIKAKTSSNEGMLVTNLSLEKLNYVRKNKLCYFLPNRSTSYF